MLSFLSLTTSVLPRQALLPSSFKCARLAHSRRWIYAQAAPQLIEVESRFRVSPEAKNAIRVLAADCEQVRFTDRYYCEQLALVDKWLRQRDHQWQLKIPVELPSSSQRAAVVYKELVGNAALHHLDQLGLSTSAMDVYATITTIRSIWTYHSRLPWGDYRMQITADECFADDGFQYNIGEIEVLVAHDDEVHGATKAVEHTCRQLELDMIDNSGGKLMRYLYEKNPDLFRKLRDTRLV